MSWLIKIKYVLVLCLKSNFSWLAGGDGHFFSLNTHYYSLFIGCEISPTFGFLKNVLTVNRLCEDKYFFAFYTPPSTPQHPGPYHSNEVAASVLSYELLLPVFLQDYRAQSTTQHYESAVGFLSLPDKYTNNFNSQQIWKHFWLWKWQKCI